MLQTFYSFLSDSRSNIVTALSKVLLVARGQNGVQLIEAEIKVKDPTVFPWCRCFDCSSANRRDIQSLDVENNAVYRFDSDPLLRVSWRKRRSHVKTWMRPQLRKNLHAPEVNWHLVRFIHFLQRQKSSSTEFRCGPGQYIQYIVILHLSIKYCMSSCMFCACFVRAKSTCV